MSSLSPAITRMMELKRTGSKRHGSEDVSEDAIARPASGREYKKSGSWLNGFRRIKQVRAEGVVETENHSNDLKSDRDVYGYRNVKKVEVEKYSADIDAVIADHTLEDNCRVVINQSNVKRTIETDEGMLYATRVADQLLAQGKTTIADEALLREFEKQTKTMCSAALIQLRISSVGLQQGDDGFDRRAY